MGGQLSKDDEDTLAVFIAEAALNGISSDGIGSLISFSVPFFGISLYHQPVPLALGLQSSCNFQPLFYRASVLKLSSWIPRHYGVALSCMLLSSLLSKFWNLNYRRALNLDVTRDVRCVLIFIEIEVSFPLLSAIRMELAMKILVILWNFKR